MIVKIVDSGLLIEAETQFEADWCAKFLGHAQKGTAFLKCGQSAADILGIKIIAEDKES